MEANAIIKVFESYLCRVLKTISEEHGLEYDELHERYVASKIVTSNTDQFDQTSERQQKSTKGKNKGKTPKKKSQDDNLQVSEFVYNGTTYFVDQEKNVYTRDEENPKLIGVKLVDGSIKFYDDKDY